MKVNRFGNQIFEFQQNNKSSSKRQIVNHSLRQSKLKQQVPNQSNKMNHKLRISLIVLSIIALMVAIPLIVLSFGRIEVGYIALSYDNIIANYSSADVYQPGMHFIGVARSFIKIRQSPTILRVDAQTYTSDYFRLNSKFIVTYQIQNPTSFSVVQSFYMNFGQNAQSTIGSIVDKKIVSILSQYPSTFYKNSFRATGLQSNIDLILTNLFTYELGVPLLIEVLIQSLVIEGVGSSAESIDKQIENGLIQLKRSEHEKTQISNFVQKVKEKSLQEMNTALGIVKHRVQVLLGLYGKAGSTNKRIPQTLFKNSVVKSNLSFYSSELELRPELYATNTTQIF